MSVFLSASTSTGLLATSRPELIKSPLDQLAWVQKGKRQTLMLFDNGSQDLTLPAGLAQVHDDASVLSISYNTI